MDMLRAPLAADNGDAACNQALAARDCVGFARIEMIEMIARGGAYAGNICGAARLALVIEMLVFPVFPTGPAGRFAPATGGASMAYPLNLRCLGVSRSVALVARVVLPDCAEC